MVKIWNVVAHFEDWDSTWFVNVGHFNSKEEAEDIKSKWETFFIKSEDIFLEPENWNPKEDAYYEHPFYTTDEQEYGLPGTQKFDWKDSKSYENLVDKFDLIHHFKEIKIEQFDFNTDLFMKSPIFKAKKELLNLIKSHNREWSINKIIK
jgi:hypothetical protein